MFYQKPSEHRQHAGQNDQCQRQPKKPSGENFQFITGNLGKLRSEIKDFAMIIKSHRNARYRCATALNFGTHRIEVGDHVFENYFWFSSIHGLKFIRIKMKVACRRSSNQVYTIWHRESGPKNTAA